MGVGYKYLGRYKEIASVFIKYGFGYVVERLNKDSVAYRMSSYSPSAHIKTMSTGERMRLAFEELGPTYIKIGQILSTRKDLFDDDTIKELSKLRQDTLVVDNELCMEILRRELDRDLDEVFMVIDECPIASASIGQVYQAKLIDGSDVIIKIQKPNIEETIKADLHILKKISNSLNTFKKEWNIDVNETIMEIEIQLLRELDYKFESINGMKMKKIFEDNDEVFIPKIYDEYTTEKILIMEKVGGYSLSQIDSLGLSRDEKKHIVDIGVRSFFKQVMGSGFFHADPHPGNIFIIKRDGRLGISFVDFGMIGLIDDKTLKYLNQLIVATTNKDTDKIVRIFKDMDVVSQNLNEEALKRDLLYSIHYYYDIPFDKLSISEILNESFRFIRSHKINIPPQLVLLGKTVMILEGTSRGIYNEFSVDTITKSYLRFYRDEKLNIKKKFLRMKSDMDEYYYDLITVPGQLKSILNTIEKNNLKLDIGEMKSPTLEEGLKKFTTQVSMSIMLAACIVGSSLIMSSNNINSNRMIKYISIIGFIISFIIGITLVFLILKNNYHKNK